ncbi:hypothetical protein LWI29_003902 [Acer saccharum]|uniref:PGG domain-containing protein n=1 Tax=Acer saccharum TaxID=4024 RepID=A0AA39VYS8_ACESA|nr:hypothetical protein LWI29_003902 [Acer saccharum]
MIVSENDNIGRGKDEGNTVRSKSNNGKGENRSMVHFMEKARENELVAATVIGTGTFAASFHCAWGFVADKGPDQGTAILTRNTAFRAFVTLNTMSIFLYSLAVFNHLSGSSATHVPDTRELFKGMRLGQLLITYAMMAIIRTFFSATCVVLHNDRNLAITTCVVPMAIFLFNSFYYVTM